jgi:hypothetical protein
VATSDVVRADDGHPDRPDSAIPIWGHAVGLILLLLFVVLSVEAYFGPGLRARLPNLGLGSLAPADVPLRIFYEPGASVRVGQKGTGSEGQDRALLEGDTVLLGAARQVVRLAPGGRSVELRPTEGSSTIVVNLGAWDRAAERLTGASARYQGGQWIVDDVPLKSVGAVLHPPGAPSEALTDGFWLGPDPDAGRVRRVGDRDGAAVRLRASRKLPSFTLESGQPLQMLDGVLVSVSAVVRAQPGKTMALTIKDVVDASGSTETVTDRRTSAEDWVRLTVRRRMAYPSPADTFSVGLVDAEAGDWIEVRDLDVVLGVVP